MRVGAIALALAFAFPCAAAFAATAPPVYPGAVAATRPDAIGMKKPPASAKTYSTSDHFAKVKAWYKSHLPGATETQRPGMEKTEDAFLVGSPDSGMVVYLQSYRGKTWIVIGPPA